MSAFKQKCSAIINDIKQNGLNPYYVKLTQDFINNNNIIATEDNIMEHYVFCVIQHENPELL